MKKTKKRKIGLFECINDLILILIGLVCIYPFINIFAVSISNGSEVAAGRVFFLPKGVNFAAYKYILTATRLGVMQGIINSVLYTVVGTVVAVFVTYLTGYVLTRKRFKARNGIMLAFMVTFVFEAGLIPNYIINNALGLVNNPLVMILPTAINTFLLIICRSFLLSVPDSLEEAAFIDGANDFQIMYKIYLPISKSSVATIALFYAVQIWNSFLWPLIYLQDVKLQPLQLILYNFVVSSGQDSTSLENMLYEGSMLMYKNLECAMIFVTMVPILIAYPFVQKYFAKGILIGAVKE